MIRALADVATSAFDRGRLLLLVVLSLMVASSMSAACSPRYADWSRFAAAMIALTGLVPLTNEAYVRWGTHGVLALAAGIMALLISLWSTVGGILDLRIIAPTLLP